MIDKFKYRLLVTLLAVLASHTYGVAHQSMLSPDNLVIIPTITQPTGPILCNGSISLQVSNGTPPYSFQWDTGDSTAMINNLCTGIYTVTVSDSTGLDAIESYLLDSGNTIPLFFTLLVSNVSCSGGFDGSISLQNLTGVPPITAQWSTGGIGPGIDSLGAGDYYVTISDGFGADTIITISISEPDPIICNFFINPVDPVTDFGGVVTASVTGGTTPYSYSWSTGGFQTPVLQGVDYGLHTVNISDGNSCSEQFEFFVDFSFLPDWTLDGDQSGHTMEISETTLMEIYGNTISKNDFIGAFFDSSGQMSCGGYLVWRESAAQFYLKGESAFFPNSGFEQDERIAWKIWQAGSNTSFEAAVSYNNGFHSSGNYSEGAYSFLDSIQVVALEGMAYNSSGSTISNGKAILYEQINNLYMQAGLVDIQSGSFRFEGILPKPFLVQILPHDELLDELPVYSGNGFYWQNVSPIQANDFTTGIDISLQAKAFASSGNGSVSGVVYAGSDPSYVPSGSELYAANVIVFLLNENLSIADYRLSKAGGEYEFNSLALGSYFIKVEKAGLVSEAVKVVLSETVSNAEQINFTLEEGNVVGIERIFAVDQIKIFPQPASGHIIVDSHKSGFEGSVTVLNGHGQEFNSRELKVGQSERIDLSSFPSGIYLLRFNMANDSFYRRIIVL